MLSPYQAQYEFHGADGHSHLDTDLIINPLGNSSTASGWKISYPQSISTCSTIVSTMRSHPNSNFAPTTSPYSHRRSKATQIVNANAVLASSKALQHQMSLSHMSTLPELIPDHEGDSRSLSSRSNSETSLYESELPSRRAPLPTIPASEDFPGNIWSEPLPGRTPPCIPLRKSSLSLSSSHRNYGSANLSDLDVTKSTSSSRLNLNSHQSQEKSPSRQRPSPPRVRTQRSYLAFPPLSTQYEDVPPMGPTRQHHSWSDRQSEAQVEMRPRANTAPLEDRVSSTRPSPSNLSTCTTIHQCSGYISDPDSTPSLLSATSSNLYIHPRTPPPTSPHHPPELMEFMSQQSYFFHDDDDDEEETWFETQKRKWLRQMHPKSLLQQHQQQQQQHEREVERERAGTPHPNGRHIYRDFDGGARGGGIRKKSLLGLKEFFRRGK